jgi:ATP-dependent DNA helicase RecQ
MTFSATEVFKDRFPLLSEKFELKPFQAKAIEQVYTHPAVLAIMPTGGGKSLIYWVAAAGLGGTCLVVSPLIALIDEQADKLQQQGFSVLVVHSQIGASEQMKRLKDFADGSSHYDFIFASPERMATDGFFEYCISVQKDKIKLLVIDEIHCVSQWGFDFRPFYTRIPVFLNSVFQESWPKILGLTATINPKELADIAEVFHIPRYSQLVHDTTLRFDINLWVEKHTNEDEKRARLWQLLTENSDEKILVYVYRKYFKGSVEELCAEATLRGFSASYFHGDLNGLARQEIITSFKSGGQHIVFATNAFGMGIDIPDIRIVIHFTLPESIEQYYQEIGRAGRDGQGADAYMLFSDSNIRVRRTHFIEKAFPKSKDLAGLFMKLTNNQIGLKTHQYFDEETLQTVLPYFLNCGAIEILGKGFTNLKVFKTVTDVELVKMVGASRTGGVITVMGKPDFVSITCKAFFDVAYHALLAGAAALAKKLDKCLIIRANEAELSEEQFKQIEEQTEQRKAYKHNLLDYLVYLFENYDGSVALHQEVGRYLGVNKHPLKKIHQAKNGIWVRSKSEVIIANLLIEAGLVFSYEEKLYYNSRQYKEPDFTIRHNGKTWYWEHLGMLDLENYNHDWQEKKQIYEDMGITAQIITSRENAVLSHVAEERINMIRSA